MRIAIASDHAGYRYKTMLVDRLGRWGHEVRDFGTASEEPVDYPDYVRRAAEAVARGECERGIVLGGSGNGEAIAANRVRGVRCALCWNEESARLARAHNDSNVISLGQRLLTEEQARAFVEAWLSHPFEGGRHVQRIAKLDGAEPVDERPRVWVGHVSLPAPDVAAARDFMVELGMRPIADGDDFAVLELRGGTHIVLLSAPERASGPAYFDLMADDLAGMRAHLRSLGLEPTPIEKGRIHSSFNVVAPSGHELKFNSSHVSDRPV